MCSNGGKDDFLLKYHTFADILRSVDNYRITENQIFAFETVDVVERFCI